MKFKILNSKFLNPLKFMPKIIFDKLVKDNLWQALRPVVIPCLVFLIFFLLPHFAFAAALDIPCKPEGAGGSLISCINQIYKYALIISSIAAVFMIMLGGYLYIFSGGSEKRVGTAKSFIFTSLLGLAVLLAGFLILRQINPSILTIKDISPGQIASRNYENYGNSGIRNGTSDTTPRPDGQAGNGQTGQVQGSGVSCNGGTIPPNRVSEQVSCSCFDSAIRKAATSTGVDQALIRAVLQQETKCGQDVKYDSLGSGVMQIKPEIVNVSGGIECPANWASDPDANILCGARNLKKWIARYGSDGIKYVLAGYNGGYAANQASAFCPGMRKFECAFDNAEHTVCNVTTDPRQPKYDITRNYVVSAMRFYQEAQKCGG